MSRNEFDANEGLKDGRRVNPGPAKLPTKVYMTAMDVLFVGAAGLTALWFIGEHHEKLWQFFRYGGTLWKSLFAGTGGG
jgi:hypothetical protein